MGLLAETKKSRKIQQDPNNTKWSRDTTTFGQRMLRSHGWQPGEFLGAKDAPHADLHTAASASIVKVSLKEDSKGLGFDRRKEDEVTGLGVFSDLLSRLNGKSEVEIVENQQARLIFKTHRYVEQRWGRMNFVKGGLLVQDKMEALEEEADAVIQETQRDTTVQQTKEQHKKRKAVELSDDEDAQDLDAHKEAKRRRKEEKSRKKKEKKLKKSDSSGISADEESTLPDMEHEDKKTSRKKGEKKEKNGKKKNKGIRLIEEEEDAEVKREENELVNVVIEDVKELKKKSNKKKKEGKTKEMQQEEVLDPIEVIEPSGTSAVVSKVAVQSTVTRPNGGRAFVRSRFIAQKKNAVLDAKALSQIFMTKV